MVTLHKLAVFLFVLSILVIVKEILTLVILIFQSGKGQSGKIEYTAKRTLILGISIAYIFTMLITGFNFI